MNISPVSLRGCYVLFVADQRHGVPNPCVTIGSVEEVDEKNDQVKLHFLLPCFSHFTAHDWVPVSNILSVVTYTAHEISLPHAA